MIYEMGMVIDAKTARENSKKYDYDKVALDAIMKMISEEVNVGGYSIIVNHISEKNRGILSELGYNIQTIPNYGILISWRL